MHVIHRLWMDRACRPQEPAHHEVLNVHLVLLNCSRSQMRRCRGEVELATVLPSLIFPYIKK
jgi:hypothetical protein